MKLKTQKKPNLILDLDETLICVESNNIYAINNTPKEQLISSLKYGKIGVKRKGVKEFMERLSKYTNIFIYSAGILHYVKEMIERLGVDNYVRTIYSSRIPN
jgi:TFIIF-interacting CTD phosphatase-like protein